MKKKKSKKNPLEDTAILTRLARKASREAVKEAFKAGIAIHYISDGKLIREYPDGKKEYIKYLNNNLKPKQAGL
ncbi:hypothetical protein PEC302107_13540 [Pectobacterium araliae]|uniref:hypothetical protein n=1 Tax=Pectobacterium araliae TaxID=3073862 RepID=UPI002089FF93|nr:hypothetical protein PEC302107_13540 [Pectobacterium carotovorum subsp. carotovorum]